MAIKRWKKLEQDTEEFFKDKAEWWPLVYHRFYDTGSTGGTSFLPPQPGDHLVVFNGQPILIETKSSEKYETLFSCFSKMIDDQQIAQHIFWNRAGAITLFVFWGSNNLYEVWDGDYCAVCRMNGDRLNPDKRLRVCETLAQAFTDLRMKSLLGYGQTVVFPNWEEK